MNRDPIIEAITKTLDTALDVGRIARWGITCDQRRISIQLASVDGPGRPYLRLEKHLDYPTLTRAGAPVGMSREFARDALLEISAAVSAVRETRNTSSG